MRLTGALMTNRNRECITATSSRRAAHRRTRDLQAGGLGRSYWVVTEWTFRNSSSSAVNMANGAKVKRDMHLGVIGTSDTRQHFLDKHCPAVGNGVADRQIVIDVAGHDFRRFPKIGWKNF
jgi:hypothetical protein